MQLVSGDILLLVLEVLACSELKRRHPNLLFFGRGANVFLPPREQPLNEDEQSPDQKKRGKKQEKTHFPVLIEPAELNWLKKFPLYDEYDKVTMLTAVLLVHVVLKLLLQWMPFLPEFLTQTTALPFLVTTLLLLYAARYAFRVSTHNGYFTYEFKTAAVVATVTTVVLFAVRMLLAEYLPRHFEYAVAAQSNHFNVLLAGLIRQPMELNSSTFLFGAVLFSGMLTLLNIPAVVKYGSAYTQMLRESYEDDNQPSGYRSAGEALAAEKLKLECQRQLKIFNVELAVWTAIILLWGVPAVRNELSEPLMLWIVACLLATATAINILNFRHEMDLHHAHAYMYIKQLQNEANRTQALIEGIQRKVYSYIYLFWYPCYQLMLRFVVPILLFLMLAQKSYLNPQTSTYEEAKYHYAIATSGKEQVRVNLDSSCGLIKDVMLTLKQLHKCPANPDLQLKEVGINGWQLSHTDASIRGVADKVSTYGLFVKVFEVAVLSEVCWYYLLSRHLLTIFYIIFLRKTVMNL